MQVIKALAKALWTPAVKHAVYEAVLAVGAALLAAAEGHFSTTLETDAVTALVARFAIGWAWHVWREARARYKAAA